LEGRGISDSAGMSCSNIILNSILSFQMPIINGVCVC
jgi:hypothetical protein